MSETDNHDVMPILLTLLREHAGIKVSASQCESSFFELGLDSLFLTQFSVALGNRFGVKLSFRRLSRELNSLQKLAGYLRDAAGTAGPEASAPVAASRATELSPPAPIPPGRWDTPPLPLMQLRESGELMQLFFGQISIMQQQMSALMNLESDAPKISGSDPEATVQAAGGSAETILDASRPPVKNARLGRDQLGRPAWFIPQPGQPGKFVKLERHDG